MRFKLLGSYLPKHSFFIFFYQESNNARAVSYLLYVEVLKYSSRKPVNILYALYNGLLYYFSSSYLLCYLFTRLANVYY